MTRLAGVEDGRPTSRGDADLVCRGSLRPLRKPGIQPATRCRHPILKARALTTCAVRPYRAPTESTKVMSANDEVRSASTQFYGALNGMAGGDATAMAGIWSHGSDVTAMHPTGGRHVGWDAVRGSFEQFAGLASEGKVELKDQVIHVGGEMACELGVERGQIRIAGQQVAIEHRVTNVYRREAGAWKIIHHHTDLAPALVDVVSRLQPVSGQAAS